MKYSRRASFRGIDTRVFTTEFDCVGNSEATQCFCRNPNECPKKGTIDLLPCVHVPITISLPHFLHGDSALFENIASGLSPTRKEHEFFLNMELVDIFQV